MIRDDGVEAVVIASPSATHAGLALECLRLGKPVLCEKPLSTTAEDALEVVEAEVELGTKLVQLGFMRRFDRQHLAVKEAVDSGSIGAPLLFKGWHRNPHIMSSTATSESVVIDSMIHDLDSVRWMFGSEIDEVYTRGMSTRPDLEGACDLQLTQMSVGGGLLATVEVYVTAEYGYEVGLEVLCESGTAHVAPFDEAVVMTRPCISGSTRTRSPGSSRRSWPRWNGGRGDPERGAARRSGCVGRIRRAVAAESCIESLRSGSPQSVTVPERPALYSKEGAG